MAERSRASKTLLSCGLGCGGALVLLVGGCFAFQAWLKSPGELLEPTAMLDPRATAHVALRLDLAEPTTRELVDQVLAASRRPAERLHRVPAVSFLVRWSESRQQNDVKRLFPVTAAWVVWPGEQETAGVGAVVVSARGLGHQVMVADWVMGLVAGRVRDLPAHIIGGERVYEIPIGEDEVVYAFLDPAGVVVCLDRASVAPAAERLRQRRANARQPRAGTELERRLASLPRDLPLRGAVVERRGEIAQLLAWLAPDADRADWQRAWEPIEAATVAGRFTDAAGLALTLDLAVDPATNAPRREQLLADVQRYFVEHPDAGKATVKASSDGVTLDLLVDDLPRRLEALDRGGRRIAATH